MHRCTDGLFIASPAVFRAYARNLAGDESIWTSVQRALQRQHKLIRGDGIRTFRVAGQRKRSRLSGFVLATDVLRLPSDCPVNPALAEVTRRRRINGGN